MDDPDPETSGAASAPSSASPSRVSPRAPSVRPGWRKRLPWILSLAWSVLVLAMLGASQWHAYHAGIGWLGSPLASVQVMRGSLGGNVIDNAGTRFSGGPWPRVDVGRVLMGQEKIQALGPWYGRWDWGRDTLASVSGVHFKVPLLTLLLPPWLWVGWLWWWRRRCLRYE